MSERYSFSLTTFSPSGKLVQIEYALEAVKQGAPSVGIKASNGVVVATEKKQKSILNDEHSIFKIEQITKHVGMVYSGMGPDYRLLVRRARKLAQNYFLTYQEPIPTVQLVQRVASVMQVYTNINFRLYYYLVRNHHSLWLLLFLLLGIQCVDPDARPFPLAFSYVHFIKLYFYHMAIGHPQCGFHT